MNADRDHSEQPKSPGDEDAPHAPAVTNQDPVQPGTSRTAAAREDVTDTFVRPCLDCGQTIHVVSGVEQPHVCIGSATLSFAWWQGFDTAKAVADAEQAELRAEVDRLRRSIREYADGRGVHVGDEDDAWYAGYRQAQRESLWDAQAFANLTLAGREATEGGA